MEPAEIAAEIGRMSAQIETAEKRLSEHIHAEQATTKEIFDELRKINDLLSQATGARKVAVWILATTIAAIALVKGWLLPHGK